MGFHTSLTTTIILWELRNYETEKHGLNKLDSGTELTLCLLFFQKQDNITCTTQNKS